MEINKMINLKKGDCLELMNDIEKNSIDCIICDLPYGTTECSWDVIIPFESLWDHYERIIKDNGAIILFSSQPFTTKLIQSKIDLFRYELIWEKQGPSNPLLSNIMPLKNHENICIFYKKKPLYNKQFLLRMQKNKRNQKVKEIGMIETINSKRIQSNSDNDNKLQMSVMYYKREQTKFHPTQKPVNLLRTLIRMFSKQGDLILDNTMGSGSAGVASLLENRRFVGFENDEKYFKIAEKRIKEIQQQIRMF